MVIRDLNSSSLKASKVKRRSTITIVVRDECEENRNSHKEGEISYSLAKRENDYKLINHDVR